MDLPEEILKIPREKIIKPDFYYSIQSLSKLIENKLMHLFKTVNIKNYLIVDQEFFIKNLAGQINLYLKNNFLAFVLIHELEIAKKAKIISSKKRSKEIFSEFIELSNEPEWIEYLFEKYPLINKRLTSFIENTTDYISELVENLDKDFSEIKLKLLDDKLYNLLEINLFLGDLHKGNKNVCLISFNKTDKILYKPRNYNNESALSNFVNYINSIGANINVGIPRFISKQDYSWVEYINTKNVEIENDISDYYNNLGKIVFLFYVLGTADIIPDNIIVRGKTPYFIDLECLMSKPKAFKISPNINGLFEDSVIRTGMLPLWVQGEGMERDILNSVFFAFNSQTVNKRIWKNKNQGDIHLEKSKTQLGDEKDKHLPMLNYKTIPLTPELFKDVKNGFENMFLFFKKNKSVILESIQKKYFFKNIENRIILHPTAIYSTFIREINLPEYLQDFSLINDLLSEALRLENQDDEPLLLKSLLSQLDNNDIPFFYTKGHSNILYDGNDHIIDNDFTFNNNEAVKLIVERINNLNSISFKFQTNILHNTLLFGFEALNIPFISNNEFVSIKANNTNHNLNNNFLEGAKSIADFLINESFLINQEINWIGKNRDQRDGRYSIMPMNFDFYDGISGLSFFFLYLFKTCNEKKYINQAKIIFNQLSEITTQRLEIGFYKELPKFIQESIPLSPFTYPLSYIYLASHIYDKKFKDEYFNNSIYDKILDSINSIIDHNKQYDFLFGKVGLLNFLTSLLTDYQINTPTIEKLVEKCVKSIKQTALEKENGVAWEYIDSFDFNAKKYLGGFAHGTAGMSSVLYKVGNLLDDNELLILAQKALNYDRSLYDGEIKGWIDGRTEDANYDAGCWCHGASGIALSRLLISQFRDDTTITKELRIAI